MEETTNGYNDLCTNCNCLPECDSTSAGRRPVYFCEQFDDFAPEKSVPKSKEDNFVPEKSVPKSKKTKDQKPKEPEGKYKGICVNCDFRETCVNATSEGGIWHCEEYQ